MPSGQPTVVILHPRLRPGLDRVGLNLYGDFEVKLFLVLSVLFVWHINGLMAGSRVRTVGAFSAPSGTARP